MFNRYEQIPFAESARGVTVYSVKERSDPDDFILYCSDGQCTAFFAQQFYSFHPNAPVWFVGVNCSPNHRNAEYVIGRDDARFLIHESFFVDRLLGWTEKTIGIRHSRARAGVFGYSCGGAFAASMGIRHPGIYAAVFAFSIAGRPIANFSQTPHSDISNVSFVLCSGSREPKGMQNYMQRMEKWLARFNAQVCNSVLPGAHELVTWSAALNATLPGVLLKLST